MSQCTYSIDIINIYLSWSPRSYLELSYFLLVTLGLTLKLLDLVDDDGLVDPAGALGRHIVCETLAPGEEERGT